MRGPVCCSWAGGACWSGSSRPAPRRVTATTFHYGDRAEPVELAQPLYAPATHGARHRCCCRPPGRPARRPGSGSDVTELLRDDRTGRVTGVLARVRGGDAVTFRAPLTIGADGLRSTVARLAGAPTVHRGGAASALVYGYWPESGGRPVRLVLPARVQRGGHPDQRRPGLRVGRAARRTLRRRARPHAACGLFARVLAEAAPEAAALVAGAERIGPLRGFPGCPGTCAGPPGPGGRWSATPATSRTRSPRTASPTPCATPSSSTRAVVDGGGRTRSPIRADPRPAVAAAARGRRVDRGLPLGHRGDPRAAAGRARP